MQVVVENVSDLERKLKITIDALDVTKALEAKLRKIVTHTKMPGFRQGKVPFDVIQKKYARTARAEVLEDLIHKTYTDAVAQKQLNPVGPPKIELFTNGEGENFVYSAICEILPEIKLGDFKQINVEKNVAQITEKDVEDTLAKMRKKHAMWQEVDDPTHKAQAGDQLTVDFTVTPCNAEDNIPPKTEKGMVFVLGDGYKWQEFEQPLYGVSCGEEKKFTLEIPATHTDKDVAGKRVNFVVTVQKLCAPLLPADDELLAKMHVQEGGMAKLQEEIRGHIERELHGVLQGLFKSALIDKILAMHPISVPQTLIENELKRQEQKWHSESYAYTKDAKQVLPFPRDKFEKVARDNVALGLIMSAYIKEHALSVTRQEVVAKIQELVNAYYDANQKMVDKLLNDKQHLARIEAMLLEEKVLAHLATQVNVLEKQISYKEAMAQR